MELNEAIKILERRAESPFVKAHNTKEALDLALEELKERASWHELDRTDLLYEFMLKTCHMKPYQVEKMEGRPTGENKGEIRITFKLYFADDRPEFPPPPSGG